MSAIQGLNSRVTFGNRQPKDTEKVEYGTAGDLHYVITKPGTREEAPSEETLRPFKQLTATSPAHERSEYWIG